MALNSIHKGCRQFLSFSYFSVYQNKNEFTVVYDNKGNTYYVENSNNIKRYKENEWLLFLAS